MTSRQIYGGSQQKTVQINILDDLVNRKLRGVLKVTVNHLTKTLQV